MTEGAAAPTLKITEWAEMLDSEAKIPGFLKQLPYSKKIVGNSHKYRPKLQFTGISMEFFSISLNLT